MGPQTAKFLTLIGIVGPLCTPCALTGQTGPDGRADKAVRATPLPPGAQVRLDGRLDEAFWETIPEVRDFVQKEPVEGAVPTLSTGVRIAFDHEALYVGAVLSGDPAELRAPVGRRDDEGQADYFLIALDTYLDRRTAYAFGVTAGGTRLDRYHPTDSETHVDETWDPVWSARTRHTADGWVAEMRIPFSQLRYTVGAERWGLNLVRWMPSREELVFWVPVPRDETGWASRFGLLEGIDAGAPSRGVELLPYVASAAVFVDEPDAADPFAEARSGSLRIGGDAKIGIGSNLTLDATVNPDFGQVEADPAEVNLSAFETFFPERRPFFTEGSQVLNRSGLFYSRRIGGLPGRVPISAAYADGPEQATILGAAKLTGRLPSGTSLGVLGALSDRETARTFDADDGFGRVDLAPRTATGVATVVQEFGENASTVGFQTTGVRRSMDAGSPLADVLHRTAVGARADWTLRFAGGAYEVFGALGGSHVRGDSAALLHTQTSSARYYQRPDQDYVSVDPGRTSLSGWSGFLGVEKNAGAHWLWNAVVTTESPGWELNDAGRLGDADEYGAFATLTWRDTDPGRWLRRYAVSLSSENLWMWDGTREFGAIRSDATLTFLNFWRLDLTGWYDVRSQSSSLSRGGPLVGQGSGWVVIARLQNSSSGDSRWNARIFHGEGEQGNRTTRLSGGLFLRPGPRWQVSVEPNYLRQTIPRQYVATRGGGPEETFGSRYIFSIIDRSTLLARVRASFAMRPDLTIELYAEPFAASGEFHGFGELPAPQSRDLRVYGSAGTSISRDSTGDWMVTDGDDVFTLANRDFNVRSFRSNAVLRWEWRPGSTVFLVWQQDRFSADEERGLVRPADLWDAVTASGEQRLLVKLSYWLPVG